MNAIFKRTSVRNFKPDAVEPEKIEKLLRAAMAAPSAGNQQPWEFVVVSDPETRAKLASASRFGGPAAAAPLNIVVLVNANNLRFAELWEQDLGACTENILLEAVEQDLGAVWLGIAPVPDRMEKVAEVLALPENTAAYCIVAVGYPAADAAQQDRFDPSRIHYERY